MTMLRTVLTMLPLAALSLATTLYADAPQRRETVIREGSLKITPINAGVNPQAFAMTVSGTVLLGGNPCQARGVTAKLERLRKGNKIYLVPVTFLPEDARGRICTLEYNPVFTTVSTSVRGLRNTISDVVVMNVNEPGASVSALSALQ